MSKSEWISVDERLPGRGDLVLIWRKKGFQEVMKFDFVWLMCDGDSYSEQLDMRHNDITHWQPLPPPPTED